MVKIMEQKTLEEKLKNVKKRVEDILIETELTESEHREKVYEFMNNEGLLNESYSHRHEALSSYVSERFAFSRSQKFHFGLQNHYVSLEEKGLRNEQAIQDTENYKNVWYKSLEYINNNLNPSELTKSNFESQLFYYIIGQDEVKEIDEKRRDHVTREMINGIILDGHYRFKEEESMDHGKFNHEQLDRALERI